MEAIELKFSDEIKKEWDTFLLSCKNYHIFQSYLYLKAKVNYKFPDKWKPILIQIKDEEKVIFSCGILKWKNPFLPFSFLWAPRGPNFLEYDENILKFFYEKMVEIGKREKAVFFVFSPYIKNDEWNISDLGIFEEIKLKIPTVAMPEPVLTLSLEEDLDSIFKKMEKDTRYMIRRAEKEGLSFIESKNLDDLKFFHKILKDSGKRKKFPVRKFSYLKNLWLNLFENDNLHLFFSEKDGKILSGAVILNYGQKCWWLYGASLSNVKNNLYPNHFLQWNIIKWAKEKGINFYDLRGAMGYNHPPTSPGYGVYHFKKGFGSQLLFFNGELGIVYKKKIYKVIEFIFKKVITFLKKFF
jgi:lipid II:glycine glycyltransferase (peptidoglycan interpeptide bridge formation enzyme)